MKQKLLSLALAVALVCALLPTVALADTVIPTGSHYADVPDNAWYAEAVNAMTEGGLLTGYTDGLFHPDDPITYAQFSTVLVRVMGLVTATDDVTDGTHWAQAAYNSLNYERPNMQKPPALAENGDTYDNIFREEVREILVKDKFSLDDNIFRAEVLETLVKLASEMDVYKANRYDECLVLDMHYYDNTMFEQISPKIWTKKDIPDWEDIWDRYGAVEVYNAPDGILILLAYNIGITKGIDANGTCDAYGNVTRAQLCQLLWNMGITTKNAVTQHLRGTKGGGGCELPGKFVGYHAESANRIYQTQSGPSETTNVGCCTTLQFFKTYPTYDAYHITDFICQGYRPDGFGGGCTCRVCVAERNGTNKPTEEQTQMWEDQKQDCYDEHEQWLEEFEGTRQWEIATGQV